MLGSLGLHALVVFCFLDGRDALSAVSVFPIWVWAGAGAAAGAVAIPLLGSRWPVYIILLWGATAAIGADERDSVLRGLSGGKLTGARDAAPDGKLGLRVATLNCGGRNVDAAGEVARFAPDIVFLQEAPGGADLNALAKELYGAEGSVVGGWHCAIIARGKLTARRTVLYQHGRGAVLELPGGQRIELLSLHLEHAVTRWDLWSRSCWRAHRDTHRVRRSQLEGLLRAMQADAGGLPKIFGGDFNAPPTSNLFETIPESYRNVFSREGRGLGNTFVNRFPVLRIDHLFAGPEFEIVTARAVRTRHSDHRMLVCDLLLELPAGR